MSDPHRDIRFRRRAGRDSVSAVVLFISLGIASTFDFRDDVELLVALQGALTVLAHRAFPQL